VVTVKLDKTKPTLAPSISTDKVLLKGTATASPNATDGLSGVANSSCGSVDTSTVGLHSVICTASDKAGNSNSFSLPYSVQYRFDGFLQPINDTGHSQTCGTPCPISVFKGGSTVPVKFILKDANGNVVQSKTAPIWLTPVSAGSAAAAVDESIYNDPATIGGSYPWDGAQYHYNWSTKGFATGKYWAVGVKLDDGQIYLVYIGLR
jgi:hypothetical protein